MTLVLRIVVMGVEVIAIGVLCLYSALVVSAAVRAWAWKETR